VIPLGAVSREYARSDGWEDSPLCDEGVFLTRNALWTGGRGTGGDLTRHYDKCGRCAAVRARSQETASPEAVPGA
jgi:hypothetical protein